MSSDREKFYANLKQDKSSSGSDREKFYATVKKAKGDSGSEKPHPEKGKKFNDNTKSSLSYFGLPEKVAIPAALIAALFVGGLSFNAWENHQREQQVRIEEAEERERKAAQQKAERERKAAQQKAERERKAVEKRLLAQLKGKIVDATPLGKSQGLLYVRGLFQNQDFLVKCVKNDYYNGNNSVRSLKINSYEEDKYGYYLLADVHYRVGGIVIGNRNQYFRLRININKERHNYIRCGYIERSRR